MKINPTAIIAPGAMIGEDVEIGPYSHIGAQVVLGDGVKVYSHVVIGGRTTIGKGCEIFPFACLGLKPQDKKYAGEESILEIGDRTVIREYVTMHPGTKGGGLKTLIGNDCLFMIGVHIAHDCRVGNNVIMANNATLAGHVTVGDHAIIGGLSAVHQFVRIGKHAMIGGMSGVESDVIPYGSVLGDRARLCGLNIVGLKRHGVPREHIHALRNAYRLLFANEGAMAERLEDVVELFEKHPYVHDIIEFVDYQSSRGLCLPQKESVR